MSFRELLRTNPWVRVYMNGQRGMGTSLSAEDCFNLSLDDAISTYARNCMEDEGFGLDEEGKVIKLKRAADTPRNIHEPRK